MLPGLRKITDGVLFGEGQGPWPQTLVVGNETYYRFHDFIYLRSPIDELSEAQVLAVCSLRNSYLTFAQRQSNAVVGTRLRRAAAAFAPRHVLEVGPGSRPLFDAVGNAFQYQLAELDTNVVNELRRSGYSISMFGKDRLLTLETKSVDLIVALFVFQFPMDESQIDELIRVLHPDGVIIFNMYRRSVASRNRLRRVFVASGCNTTEVALDDQISHDHAYWFVGRDLRSKRCLAAVAALLGS